jgi:transposase
MAKKYRPVDRDQQFLLPVSMADWLPNDHLVWFVIDAAASLDTSAFHRRAQLGGVGRQGYDPDMLLTLFVYAMAHGERSSRKIERLCHTDIAFRIICASDVPDHTVLARFRQHHEQALADLLTATLRLAAQLGMLALGVVAFDGTKIAANAAKDANRSETHLRALAERYLADAAATDTAEDALFGDDRGDQPPPDLRDRSRRRQRIAEALDQITADKADAAAPTAKRAARAEQAWQRERERSQARHEAWTAKAQALGRTPPGPRPTPIDTHHKVRLARAAYDTALAKAAAAASHDTLRANLTDPQSRLLKTRTGYLQGYNCQTAVSDDQFILHADATQDTNDVHQFEPTLQAVTDLAAQLANHTGRHDLHIGTMIGDSGYDSTANLTLPGPDRLIATRQTTTITDNPPDQPTPRQAMDQRLKTPQGQQLYQRRSPLIEAPNGWLKDRRGLRQFSRRGLLAARSEFRFAAAVTNLLRLRTLGTTRAQLAT